MCFEYFPWTYDMEPIFIHRCIIRRVIRRIWKLQKLSYLFLDQFGKVLMSLSLRMQYVGIYDGS